MMHETVSTDKEKLDMAAIYAYLSREAYWSRGRSNEEFTTTIENSLCFGLYDKEKQIGFARVVTDYVVFAYLMDFFIFEAHRGKGHGKLLLNSIIEHETLREIKTFALKTKDAKTFYTLFGFQSISDSEMWMSKEKFT